MRLISASPHPRLVALLKRPGPAAGMLQSFNTLHAFGRAALYWACYGLRLERETRIWLPALHCGVDVQAVIDAGLNVEFYRVKTDLSIDEENLQEGLSRYPGVVIVIHYFGFGQPGIERVADMCSRCGSVLIEDCAHALFSVHNGRSLGDFGTISIFSFRKSLAVTDGGALKVDKLKLESLKSRPFVSLPGGRSSLNLYLSYVKETLRKFNSPQLIDFYHRVRAGSYKAAAMVSGGLGSSERAQLYELGMSHFSRRVVASVNPGVVVARRRENYLVLEKGLEGGRAYQKVFSSLPTDTCPLCLPLWVEGRDELQGELRRNGIETFRFGAAPHPKLDEPLLSETGPLRDHIICIPVHDQLTRSDIDRMILIAKPLLRRHALNRYPLL